MYCMYLHMYIWTERILYAQIFTLSSIYNANSSYFLFATSNSDWVWKPSRVHRYCIVKMIFNATDIKHDGSAVCECVCVCMAFYDSAVKCVIFISKINIKLFTAATLTESRLLFLIACYLLSIPYVKYARERRCNVRNLRLRELPMFVILIKSLYLQYWVFFF